MIVSYLKVAFRHLQKNKLYVLINTLGMGIAIACAMTVYLLIAYNIEFDNTVDKTRVKHVVKVLHHRKDHRGDAFKELVTPIPLGPAAVHDIAGITRFTRYCSDGGYLSRGDKGFHETIFFADSSFLNMFAPELAQGSYKSFDDKNSIFISERFALKYFGTEDPLGKDMVVSFNNKRLNAVVGGVLKDAPFNSTFTENVLMRIEHYLALYNLKDNDWASAHTASVLFELTDVAHAAVIGDQLKKYAATRNAAVPEAGSVRYELIPFRQPVSPNDVRASDLHLRIPSIALMIFSTLGGIILLIACFNLTNTTLALSVKRLKEIGIRKVAGSNGFQIGFQFFCEIMLTVTLSAGTGFFLSLYIIPEFAAMWELPYGLRELNSMNMVIALTILLFASAVVAGLYPAVFGGRQSPLLLFKGGKNPGGTNLFTRSLLVMQFALCTVVLIAGIIFTRNAVYQDNLRFGYDRDMLITALIQGPHEAEALREAIQEHSRITGISPSVHHFAFINAPERPASIGGEKFNATVYDVGHDYFSTVGLQLISGRLFPENDTVDNRSVVVDENFVSQNHLDQPLGAKVDVEGEMFTIAGVVSNHLTDLESHNHESYLYRLAKPSQYQILVVRAEAATLPETRQYIDRQWKKIYPDKPLQTDLQSEIVYQEANIYNRNLSKIFFFMTVLGCLLSVSGLYAMANLNMTRRTKEIGVRKVLGASVASILKLVNREFAVILLVAALLGGYGGYQLTNELLASLFAQHIDVDIVTTVICGAFVFMIGIISTSLTIWTGANANPVNALRST